MGQISKLLPWRENFAPEHDASGLESIPPGNFTHLGRRTVKNYDSVVLTVVRVNGGFDCRATKIHVRSPEFVLARFSRYSKILGVEGLQSFTNSQ